MAVVDAWICPGADGDYITLSSSVGHFRTGSGYDPYSILVMGAPDNVDQSARGAIWVTRRTANNALKHAFVFEPASNNIEYQYNGSPVFELSSNSDNTNDVWATWALTYAGGTGNLTLRRVPLATATQSHTATGASGGSGADDSAAQTITLAGHFSGTTVQQEFDCQIAFVLIVKGVELSQAQIEAWTADPLNVGDSYKSIYGANCFFWDDSGEDSVLGAPTTLHGTVTRGTGNGPDVPARAAASGSVANMFMRSNLGKVMIR